MREEEGKRKRVYFSIVSNRMVRLFSVNERENDKHRENSFPSNHQASTSLLI